MIRVEDVEFVRFSAPDLAEMRRFLTAFGLFDFGDDSPGVLRMRGTGPAPFVHETIQGEPGFAGLALRASSLADLEILAKAEGAEIRPAEGPGGGHVISLADPDGFPVDVIAGKARVPEMPHGVRAPWNAVDRRARTGETKRVVAGPAHVARLGHVVMSVSNIGATWQWWQSRFGLLVSDEVRAPDGNVAALFIRCDRGRIAVDHHALNFASIPGVPARFHHAAFEVADLDDLMAGSHHLQLEGYRHDWGVGRHILGSQVFDYWRDPWGHRIEHWTDGDVFDASAAPNVTDIPTMMGHQWGPQSPADFA
ncbi:glyoxalase [Sphingobium sp. SCG-1]|nr:glyoxalase [Sphingobium sp. SCG-1]